MILALFSFPTDAMKALRLSLCFLGVLNLTWSFETISRNYTIVLVPKRVNNPFFDPAHTGCIDAARRLGVTCLYEGPDVVDAQEQANMVLDLIDSGHIDGIAVSVIDAELMAPVIKKAVDNGISTVTFDSDAPYSARSAYIGTNNTFFGEQLGKVLKQLKPGGGTYGIVTATDPNIKERENGLRGSLKGEVWREIDVSPTDMKGNETLGIEEMFRMAQYKPTAIVPVMGAPMRSEKWRQFVQQNPNITLVVGDGMPNQLELLSENYAGGLVGQKPYEMGSLALEALYGLIEGRPVKQKFIGTNLLEHINIPLVLPPLNVDENYIGNLRIVGFVLLGLILAMALAFALWVFINRNIHVVKVAQPKFLIMIALGISMMASSIVPLSLDDSTGHDLETICMSPLWLAIIGFTITFSALFAKTWRVNRIFHTQKQFNPSDMQVFGPSFLFLAANVAVLSIWTVIDPLTYVRKDHPGTDGWNRIVSTYGSCQSDNVIPYIVPLALLNVGLLMLGNYWAYETRMITSEFSESRYIGIAMMSMLQATLTGIPLLFVVLDNPQAYYLILIFMIFVISSVILVLIFVPKMVFALSLRNLDTAEQNRLIQECVQISLSARQGTTTELSSGDFRSGDFRSEAISVIDEGVLNAECSIGEQRMNRSAIQETMEREAARNESKEFNSRDFSSRELNSNAFSSQETASSKFKFLSGDFKSKDLTIPEDDETSPWE